MDVGLAGQSVIYRKSAFLIGLKKVELKLVLLAVRQAAYVLRQHIVDVELAIGVDRCHRQVLLDFEPLLVQEILKPVPDVLDARVVVAHVHLRYLWQDVPLACHIESKLGLCHRVPHIQSHHAALDRQQQLVDKEKLA